MTQDGSLALFQYWNGLRNGRPAPKRTDIEPADIKSLLGDTFILERDMRGEAIFRLAGTRLCAIYGRELKGFAFASLWREPDRRMISRLAADAFRMKSPVVFDFEGFGSRPDRCVTLEVVLLPLDGGTESPRCLGAMSPASKPFWLGADPIIDAELGSVRLLDPDQDASLPRSRTSVPLGPLPRPPGIGGRIDVELPNVRRIRHLLVLEGGRRA